MLDSFFEKIYQHPAMSKDDLKTSAQAHKKITFKKK